MEIEANGTFYYKDIHGRPVFVDYEYIRDAGFVVLIDRSDAHDGMSVTNSMEQVIQKVYDHFFEPVTVFELYPDDPMSLARVERTTDRGTINWYPSTERDREIVFGY